MNKQLAAALLAASLLVNQAHAQQAGATRRDVPGLNKKNTKIQYGIASFYANKFNGRRTANGEIFSQSKLTAASNTLPLDTWVKVTNLHNKKSVVVRITDRMHIRNKRLIDLSKAAAHSLGYTGWGLAHVRIYVLGRHRPTESVTMSGNK